MLRVASARAVRLVLQGKRSACAKKQPVHRDGRAAKHHLELQTFEYAREFERGGRVQSAHVRRPGQTAAADTAPKTPNKLFTIIADL